MAQVDLVQKEKKEKEMIYDAAAAGISIPRSISAPIEKESRIARSMVTMKLDPAHPVESLLDGAELTRSALGDAMGIGQPAVSGAVARRDGISVAWLVRAVRAAGLVLEIRARKKRPGEGDSG